MKDIMEYLSTEESDWNQQICMEFFLYNTAVNLATGMTPYKAVFGVDAFDFDAESGRWMALDEEPQSPEEFSKRLKDLHSELLVKGSDAGMSASKKYKKLV